MHHAGAEDLDPALALAHAAALAVALEALHVHLAARLGEGEMVRAEPGHGVGTVNTPHQRIEGALEVAHGDALVDHKTLDLVEHGRMSGVDLILAVDAARSEDADGRLHGVHHAHLHGRGLAAQMHLLVFGDIEGVRPLADRVILGDVQPVKVVLGQLDLRTLRDGEAHADENVGDFVEHGVEHVLFSEAEFPARDRHVQRLGLELELLKPCGQGGLAPVQLRFELGAHGVGQLSHHGALLGAELSHLLEYGGQLALLAQIPHAERVQRVHVLGFLDGPPGHFPQGLQHFFHDFPPVCQKMITKKETLRSRPYRDERHASAVPPAFGTCRSALFPR